MAKDAMKIKGMFRVQIEDNGNIVGDSGWKENLITNLGFNEYLVKSLGTGLTGVKVSHAALGTGGTPGAADTSLSGEVSGVGGVVQRASVTAATSSGSKTLRNTATFSSANSFITASANISNIGLFNSASAGTLFAGNTYTSSTLATNQNVNVTYDIIFA